MRTLKEEVVKEVYKEMKGRVLNQLKEGTDRLYRDIAESFRYEESLSNIKEPSETPRSKTSKRDNSIAASKISQDSIKPD